MNEKLARVRQVFLDMDDTIYRGTTLFPTTLPFLDFLKRRGIGRTFLSNNSSYGKPEYVTRLCAMGIECSEDDFYISTDYTIDFCAGTTRKSAGFTCSACPRSFRSSPPPASRLTSGMIG